MFGKGKEFLGFLRKYVAKGRVPFRVFVPDGVFFAEVFDANDGLAQFVKFKSIVY